MHYRQNAKIPKLRQGCRTMLPRSCNHLYCALLLIISASAPVLGQNSKSQQANGGNLSETIPGVIIQENAKPCTGCDDCQPKTCGSCLSKLCDWIGYIPMRTGSTCGYPRTWKRRPDLYLYFRSPCRPAAPAQGVCEPCTRFVPSSGSGYTGDAYGAPLPQPTAIGSIKE